MERTPLLDAINMSLSILLSYASILNAQAVHMTQNQMYTTSSCSATASSTQTRISFTEGGIDCI